MFSCVLSLYILDINPLSVISFANTFAHSVGCLFILSVVTFAVQKLLSLIGSHLFILSLIGSHLFIFPFISFALGDKSKKDLAVIYVKECSAYVFL